jgi:hypothetical protein
MATVPPAALAAAHHFLLHFVSGALPSHAVSRPLAATAAYTGPEPDI